MDIDKNSIVYIVVDTIIAFFAVIGNGLVCFVILKSSKLKRKPMYLFVMSLAFADIAVGAVAIPFAILTKLGYPHNAPHLCIVMLSFIIIPTQISIFNLMTVSIERYFAIRHPHFHYTKLNRKMSLLIITITWFLSIVIGFLSFLWNKNLAFSTQVNVSDGNYTINTTGMFEKPLTVRCEFLRFIDGDYMLFNFLVCVLLPLLVCAVLYFLIYLSFFKDNPMAKYDDYGKTNPVSGFTPNKSSTSAVYNSCSYSTSSTSNHAVHHTLDRVARNLAKNVEEEFSSDSIEEKMTSPQQKNETWNKQGVFYNKFESENYSSKIENDSSNFSRHSSNAALSVKYKNDNDNKAKFDKRRQKKKKEIRAAAVLGIIVLSFTICWLPLHILNTIYRFSPEDAKQFPPWSFDVAILFSHGNSAVNVFLYSWRLKAFQDALNQFFWNKLRRSC